MSAEEGSGLARFQGSRSLCQRIEVTTAPQNAINEITKYRRLGEVPEPPFVVSCRRRHLNVFPFFAYRALVARDSPHSRVSSGSNERCLKQ